MFAVITLWIVQKIEDKFYHYLKTIIWFNKETAHIIIDKYWSYEVSLLLSSYLLT